jgi:hypothetical protein
MLAFATALNSKIAARTSHAPPQMNFDFVTNDIRRVIDRLRCGLSPPDRGADNPRKPFKVNNL